MGKTELCLTLADLFHTPIISADSRQMYADIPICTAAPTPAERERAEHFELDVGGEGGGEALQ